MSAPETVVTGTVPAVVDTLSNIIASVNATEIKPTACVVLMLDEKLNWAGAVSGLALDELAKVLLTARDDAIRGGSGFTVVVNKAPEAANEPERINGAH